MNGIIKKSAGILMSFLLIIATINFALVFNSGDVSAQPVHCCEWTGNGDFCVESTDIDFSDYGGCRAGYKSSYKDCGDPTVDSCKAGTCVPSGDGGCLGNKLKVACIQDNRGRWFDRSLGDVDECKIGCCNVANSLCSLQGKKVCIQDLAGGDASAYDSSITTNVECDNSCRGADLGTCKTADGCTYGSRDVCNGEFFLDKYPREVIGCFGITHSYNGCGDGTTNNDKWNVYWFDSEGNREELVESCNFPDEICMDPDGRGGDDAVCQTTSCVESCPDCYPSELKTGESVCLNVMQGHFDNERRSKGLRNYILHCQWGQIEVDNLDNNRGNRCIGGYGSDGRFNARWRDNKWEECSACGDPDSLFDYAGFAPIVGYPTVALLSQGCSGDAPLYDSCNEFGDGDCGDLLQDDGYDADFWPPVGSCNPKYPPGEGSSNYGEPTNRCNQCGGGGDSNTNVCTRQECNQIGDCVFESKITGGLGASAALAFGTYASAWALAYVLSPFPIVGDAAKAVALALSGSIGDTMLYWGLIGTFYSFGAGEGSEIDEYTLDKDLIVDGKVKLGPIIALHKGTIENMVAEGAFDELETEGSGLNGLKNWMFSATATSGAPFLTAGALALSKKFTKEQVWNSLRQAVSYKYSKGLYSGIEKKVDAYVRRTRNLQGGPIEPDQIQQIRDTVRETEGEISYDLADAFTIIGLIANYISLSKSFDTGVCLPEETKPYTTNEHCGECGGMEGQWYCTSDRCDVLGGAEGHCRFEQYNQTGKNDGICLPVDLEDTTTPFVTKINLKYLDNNLNELGSKSVEGKSLEVDEQLSWNIKTIRLNIETNERADCRYTRNRGSNYDDASTFEDIAFPLNHDAIINITEVDKVGDVSFYFKCEDVNGNKIRDSDDSNFVSLAFEPRPDTSAPLIQRFDPDNIFLPEDVNNVEISLLAYDENDVSECRYSRDNPNFEEMENVFERSNSKVTCLDTTSQDCREFTSTLELTDGIEFFVEQYEKNVSMYPLITKCQDNQGNVIGEPCDTCNRSIFVVPTFNLTINEPQENEEIWDKTPRFNVSTSTNAWCNYTLNGGEQFTFDNFGFDHVTIHEEELSSGDYALEVICNDIANNNVVDSRNFEIRIDNIAPSITKIFTEQNKLCLSLNEEAECRYSGRDIFPEGWNEGNLMVGREELTHCAGLDDITYYVMCSDSWINNATFVIFP